MLIYQNNILFCCCKKLKKFFLKIVLLTFISLIFTLTFELTCLIIDIPKKSHNNISAKGQELIPKINNNSVLLLGDKIMKMVSTQEIDDSNGNVINLALPGIKGFEMLQYLLKKNI